MISDPHYIGRDLSHVPREVVVSLDDSFVRTFLVPDLAEQFEGGDAGLVFGHRGVVGDLCQEVDNAFQLCLGLGVGFLL